MMYVGKESSDERLYQETAVTVAEKCREHSIHKNIMATKWDIILPIELRSLQVIKKSNREVNILIEGTSNYPSTNGKSIFFSQTLKII